MVAKRFYWWTTFFLFLALAGYLGAVGAGNGFSSASFFWGVGLVGLFVLILAISRRPTPPAALDTNLSSHQLRLQLAELIREKEQLEAILSGLDEAVLALDQEGRVLLANRAVKELFDIAPEEARGKAVLEVVRDHRLEELVGRVRDTGTPTEQELTFLSPQPRIFVVRASPLPPDKVVVVLREVTRERRLERMRREFVANVSHELRTPLTAIKGFVEALEDGALEDRETAQEFLQIIASETERLIHLVEDLLKLSRLENRQTFLRRQEVNLNELIHNIALVWRRRAEEKGLAFEVDLPPGLPLVLGDPELLTQVFVNLIDNALKYTPVGRVRIRGEYQSGWVRIEVEDTGIGIPQDCLPRVFERFFRVDRARSRASGGTGLGLSIVKHIVELHGGKVGVESELGKGSRFWVYLPSPQP
ncbi:multi-sensor signal transduction histidine kinase [Ammonifex degensii KC4]|uniref:histidine kinase n=1 Tax=Ammonifex degensii (strain DSM 10501 / KC4) TaxID=429009 RepID=C9RD18_AMMDK|nr:ATP-binding protein [Ammonifex degensii]ACX52145.1 multi-sensor signal transduction histidine kinase [Ammonifex degensii KC4]